MLQKPNDYSLCDTNGDTIENFNLTSVELEVLGFYYTIHTLRFRIILPGRCPVRNSRYHSVTSFPSSGQTIWIRVENNTTGCFDIVTLALLVNPIPLATQPNYPQYSLCDATMPLGFEEFDLGSKINGIQLGQNGVNVTFHFNQTDATADLNPLPLLYTNIAPFVTNPLDTN